MKIHSPTGCCPPELSLLLLLLQNVCVYIYYYLRIETGLPNSHGLSSGVHLQSLEISPEFYCHRPDSSGISQSWMPRSAIFLATPSFLGDIRYPPIFRLVPISSSESHPKKPASWFQRIFLLSLGWLNPNVDHTIFWDDPRDKYVLPFSQ